MDIHAGCTEDESCWTVVCHYANRRENKNKTEKKERSPKQHQSGAYIKYKKGFIELWFIRRYGISDSNRNQSTSQEQLTLIKLARRCRFGMCCLVLTCMLRNHTSITPVFCSASVTK